jgi:hypothetical protein
VISLLLHAGLLVATFLTWSRMMALSPESHAVPVELVIEQQTNVRAEAPPPEPDKPVTQAVQMDEPKLPAFADAEPAPLPPIPQIKIIKPKIALDQPDRPKSKKQILQDADAVLNKILAQAKPPKDAKTSTRIVQGAGNQSLATADLADALKSQIHQCWSPPVGAPKADDLVVDFDLQLTRDGRVAALKLAPNSIAAASGNPYTRAAAEAASRAIYQCQGTGYKLPPDRYAQWNEINPLRFDPREMMNQ